MIDVNVRPKDVKLIRQYCRQLNSNIMKKRVINAAITDRKSTRPELQSHSDLVCRLLLEKKKKNKQQEIKHTQTDYTT